MVSQLPGAFRLSTQTRSLLALLHSASQVLGATPSAAPLHCERLGLWVGYTLWHLFHESLVSRPMEVAVSFSSTAMMLHGVDESTPDKHLFSLQLFPV